MAEITLRIAGRAYGVSARGDEEVHLRALEALIETHAETARRASGGLSAERTLVYLALLLADQLDEARRTAEGAIPPMGLEAIAARLEAVATALEEAAPIA